jgi:hypothetical protein
MKDIVIIPAFNRPEYLYHTLKLIKKADLHDTLKYLLAVDYGYSQKCIEVINELMAGYDFEIMYNNGSRFNEMKQSYNILSAYNKAANEAKQHVFLIEDDIFIGKSFFKTHYDIQAKHPDLFCSIVSKLHNYDYITPGKSQTLDPFTCQTSNDSAYQSWGVCFNKGILLKYVLPHAFINGTPSLYFHNSRRYMQTNFPTHFLGTNYTEQDGLIRRIRDNSQIHIGYPDYPRCYHAGIWSYHRLGEKVNGWTFQKKVDFITETCFNHDKMQKYNEYNDVFIADLEVENGLI